MPYSALLSELTALPGPSGFEHKVAQRAVELLRNHMDEAYLDRYGNAVGIRRCGKPQAKRLLLDAHLDEVGLLVTGIKDGFLRFRNIGGVDPRILPNQKLHILTEPPRQGLVISVPPHLQETGSQDKATPMEELYIDCGLSQEEAETLIPIGTPVVFDSPMTKLLGGCFAGKAMDDRAGFACLLYAATLLHEETLDVDLYLLGSTREEVSGSGATVGTFALEPDCCIAVDVTHGRTPDAPKDETFPLGKGPAIGVGPNMTRWMSDRLFQKAKELDLPHQTEIMGGHSGTNAWHMQISREGVATAVLSMPLKYMHTPNEVLNGSDLVDSAKLLVAFIKNLGQEGRWIG